METTPLTGQFSLTPVLKLCSAVESGDRGTFNDGNLHEVLRAACAAPSADNNQPWKFSANSRGIDVFYDLSRRLPSDVDGMFDLLSLGAVIENITLRLTAMGRDSQVVIRLGEPCDQLQLVARVEVQETGTAVSTAELADYVFTRKTTRLPFARQLDPAILQQIDAASAKHNGVRLVWETDRNRIGRLSRLVSLSDSLRFRYREFHEELHRQLRLTNEASERSGDGLDYRTLGLPPGGRLILQWLRPWNRMAWLNRFGLATLMSLPTIRLVRASGAIGFLYIPDRTPASLIAGGRAFQRIWLKATTLGLSLHPLGSLPIFLTHPSLPDALQPLADRIRTQAKGLVPDQDGVLQMAFRIGRCKRDPSVKSQRRPPEHVLIFPDSFAAN